VRLHVPRGEGGPRTPGKEATKESMSDKRSELGNVSLWRGATKGDDTRITRSMARKPKPCSRRDVRSSHSPDAVAKALPPRGHVRLLRHDRERTPRWTLPNARLERSQGRPFSDRAARELPIIKDLAQTCSLPTGPRAKGRSCLAKTGKRRRSKHQAGQRARIAADAATNASIAGYATPLRYRALNSDYIGPAALNREWTFVNDVRDGANAARLQAVSRHPEAAKPATSTSPARSSVAPPQSDRLDAGLKRRNRGAYIKGGMQRSVL